MQFLRRNLSVSSLLFKKRQSFSTLITHSTCNQAIGKGKDVANRLGSRSTSFANPGTKRGGVDGVTIGAALLLTLTFGSVAYVTLTEQGKEKFQNSYFISEFIKPYLFDPAREKLLPDLPPLELGQPIPRTLVVDLEDTLLHLEWDANYGWRAVKRPGIDQFLMRAATSGYEIVIFSSGFSHFLEPFTYMMDPRGAVTHRLYREATMYVGDKHVKDLSKINRDLKRVIAIDDEPQAVELQPENLICVKPFNDKNDLKDNTLLDLSLLLEDIAYRDVPDVTVELARLRTIGHGDAIAGFKKEREERIRKAEEQQHKGLGGILRKGRKAI